MLWDYGLENLGQQWNQVWSAVEFYDAFAGPDGMYSAATKTVTLSRDTNGIRYWYVRIFLVLVHLY